jgi:hypothetical protein
MRTTFLAAALVLCACGPGQTEEQLISDTELNLIQSSRDGLVAAQPEPAVGAQTVHVRLAWGYFAGRRNARGWVNWSGAATMAGGQVSLENLVYFDWHDKPAPTQGSDRVAWNSRTLPHFDGLVLKVSATEPGQALAFVTPKLSRTLTIEELASGLNERTTVDSDGHEVSISAVPDQPCAGFSYGYQKPSDEGWLGFAGLFTDARGTITGRLRFRADGESVTARLWKKDGAQPYDLSVDGEPSATGEGRLDTSTGEFELALTDAAGALVARVRGSYAAPSDSPRGSYQAVVSCP